MAQTKSNSNDAPGNKASSAQNPEDKDVVKNTTPASNGVKNPLGQEGNPRDAYTPAQIIDRDEILKPEYTLADGKLEIERGHPNYIFDNQKNQQAQENTVEIAAGIRNADGTLKENHPAADDANPKVVKEDK